MSLYSIINFYSVPCPIINRYSLSTCPIINCYGVIGSDYQPLGFAIMSDYKSLLCHHFWLSIVTVSSLSIINRYVVSSGPIINRYCVSLSSIINRYCVPTYLIINRFCVSSLLIINRYGFITFLLSTVSM